MRDAYGRFGDAGAEVIGVSTDDAETGRALAEESAIPYPLIPDPSCAVIDRYAGVNPQSPGEPKANFAVFIVDRGGRVTFGMAGRPPAETILAALEKPPA